MRLFYSLLCLVFATLAGVPALAQDFLRAELRRPDRQTDAAQRVWRHRRGDLPRRAGTGGGHVIGGRGHRTPFQGVRAVGSRRESFERWRERNLAGDPNCPVISLPNISSANPRVEFALILQARCGILDTIRLNNTLNVRDQLSFRFRAVSRDRVERHVIDPYLGSISFPVFTYQYLPQ